MRSLENISRSENIDAPEDPEGIAGYVGEPKSFEQHMKELREATADNDERIFSCKNRVFEPKIGPRYDDFPNVFRTDEKSVYRITGMNQIADIVNCGYVRPKNGRIKGGHENEVFWSIGGERLNFIDERPILETSIDAVKDGQIGALSLDDLTAIWIFDEESGKRENKLETVKNIKRSMDMK